MAIALNNLALLLHATNRLAEAETLYAPRAHDRRDELRTGHPNVARAVNNLAGLLQATNRFAEAEPLMRRALAIDGKKGLTTPRAVGLGNLAGLLMATNRLAEAEPLLHRALAINEANQGPDHPDVARDSTISLAYFKT